MNRDMPRDDDQPDENDSGRYLLGVDDIEFLALAGRMLEGVMQAPDTEWAVKVSVAKLMHVFSRLPNESAELNVEIAVSSPRESYGDKEIYFSITIGVEERVLRVRYGGHYYDPRTGGDSFQVFAWSAEPGAEAEWIDCLEDIGAVTAHVDPIEVLHRMPSVLNRCEIYTFDDENTLIGDEPMEVPSLFAGSAPRATSTTEESPATAEDDEDDEYGQARRVVIDPVTPADQRLLDLVGQYITSTGSGGSAAGIENCDGCSVDLSTVGLFIDGSSGKDGWGNYCANCSLTRGVAVGWGKGQLYARQPDGSWAGIAGFKR